jgi:hypothetical protein
MKPFVLIGTVAMLALAINPRHAHAQSTENNSRFKISAVNVDFGVQGTFNALTNSDYLRLRSTAEDQTRFISNPQDYTLELLSGSGGSFAPNISIGLSPYSKKKGKYNRNHELRLKLGSGFGLRRSFVYTREVKTPFDTLSSSIGNPDTYVDSVYYHNPSYSEVVYELNLGVTYLFKTNTEKRWHFYTGFGTEYGIAFQSFAAILNEEGYYLADGANSPNSISFRGIPDDNESQTYRSALTTNSQFLRFYVPLGLNFRIANKNEFWRHFNLYIQTSGGMELHFVSNGGDTYTNAFGALAFLGVRYTID